MFVNWEGLKFVQDQKLPVGMIESESLNIVAAVKEPSIYARY